MGQFKVIAGDFGQGAKGDVRMGRIWKASAQGLNMPIHGQTFKTEHIAAGQIDILEIATQESLKKMAGSVGWGFLGGLALGPIGALAGVLSGGRKAEVTFTCQFKDGRKFLGQCDPKTYTEIQAARFVVPARSKPTAPPPAVALFILAMLAIFVGVVIWAVNDTPSPVATHTSSLKPQALQLATYSVAEDMNVMLAHDQSSPIWPKVEDLLTWLHLAWRLPASEYESRYDANEIAADNDFKGQRIMITGTVSSISKDFTDEGYIVLRSSGLMGVRAQLSETGARSAASLKKGQTVALVCRGGGQVMTIATLSNCESLKDYINGLSPSLQDQVAALLESGKALGNSAALPIVGMYVMGLHMPPDSPCLAGARENCKGEMKSLLTNRAQSQAIQAETKAMSASLQVH